MAFKLTVSSLLCVSVVGLSGCATTAEMERLRTEIARANAIALRAAADAARTQRELTKLKEAEAAVDSHPYENSQHGYKWSTHDSWRSSAEAQ